MHPGSSNYLHVGCWNVRTLVEADGDICTGMSRPGGRRLVVDRKVEFLVRELKRCKVNMVRISETKWFGQAVYLVDGCTVVHSGRPVPAAGDVIQRGEGVGIVLDPVMSEAWRSAGEVWKVVSSRIVMLRLLLTEKEVPGLGSRPLYITLLSVYAPTHRSCPDLKSEFYNDLQVSLDFVPKGDLLIMVGDFNARVGSNIRGEDSVWHDYHGVGELNESGEDLLSFCALNELTIMNTMFEKASIFKHTWQHPGTKHWHCIDYIIMRRADRSLCYDVSVRRSAECWTDHKLLCMKLGLKVKRHRAVRWKKRKYAVTLLRDDGIREEFNAEASKLLSKGWRKESSATSKGEVIRDSLLKAATSVLGWEDSRQPDWFVEAYSVLRPLVTKRNQLFRRWLRTQLPEDRERFVNQRRHVAKMVREAKNNGYQQQAQLVECGVADGGSMRAVWRSLRNIQRGRAGLQPVRPKSI